MNRIHCYHKPCDRRNHRPTWTGHRTRIHRPDWTEAGRQPERRGTSGERVASGRSLAEWHSIHRAWNSRTQAGMHSCSCTAMDCVHPGQWPWLRYRQSWRPGANQSPYHDQTWKHLPRKHERLNKYSLGNIQHAICLVRAIGIASLKHGIVRSVGEGHRQTSTVHHVGIVHQCSLRLNARWKTLIFGYANKKERSEK